MVGFLDVKRACARASWGFTFSDSQNANMAGRKNRGMLNLIYARARAKSCSVFDVIDPVIDELLALDLASEATDEQSSRHNKAAKTSWRLPKKDRPRCGAMTRKGTPCKRQALGNGRCRNHGGCASGPKSEEGRRRIAEAQRLRWQVYQAKKNIKGGVDTSAH
jgi:hypothetical protein